MERFVRNEIKTGRYNSASDVVSEALRLLEQREQVRNTELTQFRAEIDRRLAALDAGENIEGEECFETLRHKSEERRNKRTMCPPC